METRTGFPRSRGMVAATCLMLGLAVASPALAQLGTPPVSIVVATSPGTGVDVIGRVVAEQLTKQTGKPFVVENRVGASGNIGAEYVARSEPNGRTLFVGSTSFGTNPSVNTKLPYDTLKDFKPIILMSTGSMGLAVSPSLPVNSVKDFVKLARDQPGRINYASPGNGTPQHLAMELFKLEAKVDLFHIPYKTTGGALTDLAGGHVSAMIVPLDTALPLIQGGKIKILGVMSPERFAGLPNVPTFKEQGYPEVQVSVWYGLFAPAQTPDDVIASLNREINKALAEPSVAATLTKQAINPAGGTPQRQADLLKSELEKWPRVVKAANISAD